MSIQRVTQSMLTKQSYGGLQTSMNRLAKVQEKLTTGRLINRPSDDPTGATTAMRIRTSIADNKQYIRNGTDAQGWLDHIDSTLSSVTNQIRRARELGLQGANGGAMGPEARVALAVEVEQIRDGLITAANTQYLDRPVFGGVTAGDTAYNPDGTLKDPAALGTGTGVVRSIAPGAKVRVDVEGPDVFGAPGSTVFDNLTDLANALRAGNQAGIDAANTALSADTTRVINVQADIGARANRVQNALTIATDGELTLSNSLSEVENVDLAKAVVDLKLQDVAYQAALGATSRVIRPSLLDFLR